MEAFSKHKVALLGDDRCVVESIIERIQGWGLEAKGFTHTESAVQFLVRNKCDIVLLDIFISGICCLPFIPSVMGDAKIMVMTEVANKDTAIRALKLGAFDLLEKPLRNDLLRHSVFRALTALESERESKKLADDLKFSRLRLLAQQQRLESLNAQLVETNKAVAVFAQNMQREREEIEKRAALRLRSIILPVVAKLKSSEALQEFESQFDMLTLQVEDLTSGLAGDSKVAMVLSSAEMRVASLIKNGATTEKVAAHLHISENTVRTHRKNIRRKLKIGAQYSLRNFLNSRTGQAGQVAIGENRAATNGPGAHLNQ
ncbi:MAG: LuxR C-terminal-related transcriptional regulator [Syntrophobacteraceae bacterium]|nr:LuxR C-terminal-related transcriptional regulator [Syntrophobacteraceae bacterium]